MRFPTRSDQSSRARQWGRKDGSLARTQATMRRLLRLVIALVLVIVVMNTAGNPDIYRPFFGDQQPNVDTQPSLILETPRASDDPRLPDEPGAGEIPSESSAIGLEPIFPDAEFVDFARQLVPLLSEQERTTLTHLLAWQRHRSPTALERLDLRSEDVGKVIDSVEEAAESLQSGVSDDADLSGIPQRYAKSLRAILSSAKTAIGDEAEAPRDPAKDGTLQLSHRQGPALKALQYALDETYQQKVVDGAVWSAGDADAFYRYLERADSPSFLPPSTEPDVPSDYRPVGVGVVPLLQQPTIYQGRMVRIKGTVARASRIEAKENPFGITEYWEVWIRPADGTERPVLLYVPDVSERIAAVGPKAALNRGPAVSAVGVFMKRRLFHAVGGVEEAPVIVGRAIEPSPLPVQSPLAASGPGGPSLWLLVIIAAIVGVVIAGWLTWQSTLSAKRSRQLRHRAERVHLSPESIGTVPPPDNANEDRAGEPR